MATELLNPNDFTTKKYLSEHLVLTNNNTTDAFNIILSFVDTFNSKSLPITTWFKITNLEIPAATTKTIGLMSSSDKQIIDYFKQSKSFFIQAIEQDGSLLYDENSVTIGEVDDNDAFMTVTINKATPTTAGVMSSLDKIYLDEYSANRNYFMRCAPNGDVTYNKNSIIIGKVVDTDIYVDSPIETQVEIREATTKSAGVMSAADKSLLDSISTLNNFDYSRFTKNFIITIEGNHAVDEIISQDKIYSINHTPTNYESINPDVDNSDYNAVFGLLYNLCTYFEHWNNIDEIYESILKYVGCLSNIKFMMFVDSYYQSFYFQKITNTGIFFSNHLTNVKLHVFLNNYTLQLVVKELE